MKHYQRPALTNEFDKDLFLLCESITDELMGPGTYEALNGYSPAKGQFPMQLEIRCVTNSMVERMIKYGSRTKVILICGCHKFFTADQIKHEQVFIGRKISHQGFEA